MYFMKCTTKFVEIEQKFLHLLKIRNNYEMNNFFLPVQYRCDPIIAILKSA